MELLQRHDLLEAQVSAHGAQVSHLAHQATELSSSLGTSVQVLPAQAQGLTQLHQSLVSLVRAREELAPTPPPSPELFYIPSTRSQVSSGTYQRLFWVVWTF